jgi:thiamine-monophosphate kinase
MKIEEMGGEFALIDRLSELVPNSHGDLLVGMGDDAAVIRTAPEPAPFLLVTTDILVEERHFRRPWAEPEQIGIKAAESNLSDIAAMGGRPTWMFISLVLSKDTDERWPRRLYDGIGAACRRHGVIVAGGDTSRGSVNTINITLLGTVAPAHLCLRSQAVPGDLLMVTGPLGASAAALALLTRGEPVCDYLLEKHLAPTCRLDAAAVIAPLAHAMIDISDGLGSEVHHICHRSRVSAEIHADTIPLHQTVRAAGETLQTPPVDFAIRGGEDYELLFSIAEENLKALEKSGFPFYKVGRVTAGDAAPVLLTAEGRLPLERGFNHF